MLVDIPSIVGDVCSFYLHTWIPWFAALEDVPLSVNTKNKVLGK